MNKIIIILCLFFFNIGPSFADTRYDNKLLEKIEQYLNNITSIKSNFVQLNADSSLSEGQFYLLRPGKFRWEYNDQPIVIVANGKSLIYHDTDLEQVNYIPIEKSIAALITRKNITFAGDLEILDLIENQDSTKITFMKKGQKDVGAFSFIFKHNPFELGKIETIDDIQQKIIITFFDIEFNQHKFKKSLFKIRDPRLK